MNQPSQGLDASMIQSQTQWLELEVAEVERVRDFVAISTTEVRVNLDRITRPTRGERH